MNVYNNANTMSGFQAMGAWTVVAAPPVDVSVTPASGSGASQAFSFVYSDPYGNADIHYVEILFQTQISAQGACYLQYVPANNAVSLVADSGAGYAGSSQLGVAGTLSNNQCIVDAGVSSTFLSGNNITVTVALTFKPAFVGAKNIYMNVYNNANTMSG